MTRSKSALIVAVALITAAAPAHAAGSKLRPHDLGTLGGDFSRALGINKHAQIVGDSENGKFDAEDQEIVHAFLWERGVMRDLGTLGGDNSTAQAVNDGGQVVGVAERATGSIMEAFLWENGRMKG